jgi:hypothetical protein
MRGRVEEYMHSYLTSHLSGSERLPSFFTPLYPSRNLLSIPTKNMGDWYSSINFQSQLYVDVSGQCHVPAALTPAKELPLLIKIRRVDVLLYHSQPRHSTVVSVQFHVPAPTSEEIAFSIHLLGTGWAPEPVWKLKKAEVSFLCQELNPSFSVTQLVTYFKTDLAILFQATQTDQYLGARCFFHN